MDAAQAPAGAPQAPGTNGATNGAHGPQSPAKGPPPATVVRPTPTPKPQGAPANTAKDHALGRGKDGKFLTKNGEPAPEPEVKEPFRFKRKLKTDGVEEDVDFSEDDLVRELQLSRTARKRLSDIANRQKELDAREARLKTAPHEVLSEAGIDPDEWATKRLAQKAQDGLMSEEERAYRDMEARAHAAEAREQERQQQDQERETKAYEDEIWKKEEPAYLEAFKKYSLPTGSDVMGLLGQVGEQFYDAKMPMSPEHIVAETSARLDKYANRYVFDLPLPQLMTKLGPEKVEAIVREHIRVFRESQSRFSDAPAQDAGAPPPEETGGRRGYISSAEVDRRARELISKMK